MRLFVAIDFSLEFKKLLVSSLQELYSYNFPVLWTPMERFHITLKFFGSLPQDRVVELEMALLAITKKHTQFMVSFGDIGLFGPHHSIVSLSVKPETGIKDLQQDIERIIHQYGFSPDIRPFVPHVTLGRVKKPFPKTMNVNIKMSSYMVEDIVLMESILHSPGPTYVVVKRFPFFERGV